MFKDIKAIRIKGGCFEKCTELSFLGNKKDDPKNIATIIYGSNGSGKSTIANALLHYKNSDNKEMFEVKLLDKNNQIINIPPDKLDGLHIFNEKFINDNVRFAEYDKLNTIVLLGEMLELDDQINELKETKNNEEKALEKYKNTEKELTDIKNLLPTNIIKTKLKKNCAKVGLKEA